MKKDKPNLLVQTLREVRKIANEMYKIQQVMEQTDYRFTNPFEFSPLYSEEDETYIVLLYYQGKYFDYKGRDKGKLYDLLGIQEPQKEVWLRAVKVRDLPHKMSQYKVSVAIGRILITGDYITTLGHIISPQSYTIRLYKNRINNRIYITHEGKQLRVDLGKVVVQNFMKDLDYNSYRVFYFDNDFTNNRIENLQILEGEDNE